MEQCERKEPGQARRYKFTGKEQTPVPLSRLERHLGRRIDAVHRKELVQSLELRVYGLEFIGFRPVPSNRRRPSQRTHQSAFHRPCRGNRSAQRHQSGPAARKILSAVSSSVLSFLSSLFVRMQTPTRIQRQMRTSSQDKVGRGRRKKIGCRKRSTCMS